jgi:lysophospholipase L1-like esterase
MLVFVVDVGPGPTETDPGPVAEARLVVFGDSYISGEGARQYFKGTNTAGGDECRRAPSSYAHLLSEELGLGLDFYACSGATTDDVAVATGGVPTQLQAFLDDESSRAEAGLEPIPIAAVLVSVGGNDAWFGTVGQACLGPGSCDVHRDTLFGNVADIVARIETVHREIRNAVGEAVPVVAMPYPLILTESGCESSMLFSSEHQFLFEFTDVLNSAVEVAAKRAGVNFFSPGITAFDPVYDPVTGRQIRRGHRICDQDQEGTSLGGTDAGLAVNVIDIQPKEGALADRLLPTNWLHGSAHPNEVGHRLTADALTDWLAGVEGNPSPEPWAERGKPPPGQRVVSTRLLGIPDVVLKPSELRIPGELPAPVAVDGLEAQASYALSSLRVGSFVYHSQPNGEWFQIGPTPDDGSAAVPAWDGGQLDCSAEAAPTNQVIIWQARDGGWSAEVRHYCGRSNGEIGAAPIAIPAQLNELQVPPADELPVSAAAEASELGSPYPVGTAMAGSFVYYSQPNGEWLSLGPIDAETASSVPGWGRETQIDFDADSMAPRQVILWKQRFTGNWHIVVRQYCELDPECPDSEDEIRAWTISQIGSTIRQGTVPVILLFVGFWSLAIHLAVGQHHRSSWGKRLFPWVPLPISKDDAPDTSAPLCP